MNRIGSFFITESTLESEVDWFKQNNISTLGNNPNILTTWDNSDQVVLDRVIAWHRDRGLRIGISIGNNWVLPANWKIYPSPDNIYYLGYELDFSGFSNNQQFFKDSVVIYKDILGRLPANATVIWSPYFSELGYSYQTNYMAYVQWLKEVCIFGQTYVSSLQDGVGCVGDPSYPPSWGNRLPGTKDYKKVLQVLRAHFSACHACKVIPRVNIELFTWDIPNGQWVFAPSARIKKQVNSESQYCYHRECGPAFILTNGSMGLNYHNEEFIKNY